MLDMHYFLPHIQRRGYNHKPLTEREKQGNLTRSRVRARVEHVFGIQSRLMSAMLRCVGEVRAKCTIGLRNLVFSTHRYGFILEYTFYSVSLGSVCHISLFEPRMRLETVKQRSERRVFFEESLNSVNPCQCSGKPVLLEVAIKHPFISCSPAASAPHFSKYGLRMQ